MLFTDAFILAIAMALDALIVSFSYGLIMCGNKYLNAFKFAFAFGLFQFIMPIFGWNLTGFVYDYLKTISSFAVFTVFFVLAMKFLKDAFSKEEKVCREKIAYFHLLLLALVTSIDALFAGGSIRLLNTGIVIPAVVIGIVTFTLSGSGYLIAGKFKKINAKFIQCTGAVLLLYLAIKAIIA